MQIRWARIVLFAITAEAAAIVILANSNNRS